MPGVRLHILFYPSSLLPCSQVEYLAENTCTVTNALAYFDGTFVKNKIFYKIFLLMHFHISIHLSDF